MLSVIIPTRDRADLLRESLGSLVRQTTAPGDLEVIVVDDGSSDHTREVCRTFSSALDLKYWRISHSGIAAAKNLGVFTSRGSILLFFDDDDLADEDLCQRHLESHERYPDSNIAILGYTDWASSLTVTPLMRFLTDIGQFQFSYPSIRDGQTLDWTGFWGGRTSCKRLFLVRHGVFNPDFTFGYEDDELGYRLSQHGLKVIFNRQAVQHMNRSYTFDEFCQRCVREGSSQWRFSQLHPNPLIEEYCQVVDAERRWEALRPQFASNIRQVRKLEAALESLGTEAGARQPLENELMTLYGWTFRAFKLKGVIEAMKSAAPERVATGQVAG